MIELDSRFLPRFDSDPGIAAEETVAQIRENPFLQYFLGLHEPLRKDLFDPSMMV